MKKEKSEIYLEAQKRETFGRKIRREKKTNLIPAILYGPKIKNTPLFVDYKKFEKILDMAGESSLINLTINSQKDKFLVLIHDIKRDSLNSRIIHVDFYQPDLEKRVTARLPLILEGESSAVKDFQGTIVQNISEIEIKALPMNLPRDIRINIEKLKNFEDVIKVKDLIVPQGVEILKDQEEILVSVAQPTKVEEELAKPLEEEMKEPELVKKKEKEEEVEDEDLGEENKPKEKQKS